MTTNRMVLLIGLAAMLMIAASAHLVARYFRANVSADAREQFATESAQPVSLQIQANRGGATTVRRRSAPVQAWCQKRIGPGNCSGANLTKIPTFGELGGVGKAGP